MQSYLGSSNLSQTVFFTAPSGEPSVYLVSGFLSVTGTGDDVTFQFRRNNTIVGGTAGEQGEYIFYSSNVLLSENDELSVSVNVNGTFSWNLQLRLVRISDELAPLE